MRDAFAIIVDDFENELSAIGELVNLISPGSHLTARARIAASNSQTLLLASVFEEYVRQIIRAAYFEKQRLSHSMADFPEKVRKNIWKSSFERISRRRFDDLENNLDDTKNLVQNIISFCLDRKIDADVSLIVSTNDINMRPDEIKRMLSLLGLGEAFSTACRRPEMIQFFGSVDANNSYESTKSKFEQFFKKRNNIAHELRFGSAAGPSEAETDIEFIKCFSTSLSQTIDDLL